MQILLLSLLNAAPFSTVFGQAPAVTVKCEVASIKAAQSSDPRRRGMEFLPGGRFRAANTPLFMVLATAYNVPWYAIEAFQLRFKHAPEWMFSEAYDIEAKARNAQIRLMLQSLLADRLNLRLRREVIEEQGYVLVVAKGGPKLQKSKTAESACVENAPFAPISATAPACHQIQGGSGRGIHATAIDLSDLALFLSNWSDGPVVDGTGLTGLYAVETPGWTGADSSHPSFDEVLQGIGLRLARKTVPLETFVIEHVEKPSAN